MVRLKRLTAFAFRSFADETVVEFPGNGLLCILGINHDTNGSSAAGKSTIGYAIAYALGFCPYSAGDLQSNITSEPMQVVLELETDEGPVVIKRGKVNSVKTQDKTITSAKAINEKIKEIIGLPTDFLAALTFHQQQEPGTFLRMTDSVKKEFLSQLLGLEELEDQIDRSTKAYKTLEEDIGKADAAISVLKPLLIQPTPIKSTTDELVRDEIGEVEQRIVKLNSTLKSWETLLHKYSDEYWINRKNLEADQASELQELRNSLENVKQSRVPPDISVKSPEELELEQALSECDKRVEEARKRILTTRAQLDKEISDLNAEYNKKFYEAQKGPEIVEKILVINNKISAANAQKCLACEQPWVKSSAAVERWQQEKKQYELDVVVCTQARLNARELGEQLDSLHRKATEIDRANASELQALLDTHDNIFVLLQQEATKRRNVLTAWEAQVAIEEAESDGKLSGLRQVHQTKLYELEKEFNNSSLSATVEYNTVKEQVSDNKAKLAELQASFKQVATNNEWEKRRFLEAQQRFEETSNSILGLEAQKLILSDQLDKEKDFAVALKSFLGSIFDEVLAEISVETNELLKQVPNVATTVVQFTSEKITGKGIAKQEIRPIVIKSGKAVPLKAGLSGGQFTSVDLAVDLAVGIVISRRTNKTPGWLILDESFDGHDVPVKEACLAMLKKVADKRLILIVDHASEVKEMFDSYITVESRNDVSWIKP